MRVLPPCSAILLLFLCVLYWTPTVSSSLPNERSGLVADSVHQERLHSRDFFHGRLDERDGSPKTPGQTRDENVHVIIAPTSPWPPGPGHRKRRDLKTVDNFAARLVNANADDENFTGKDKKRGGPHVWPEPSAPWAQSIPSVPDQPIDIKPQIIKIHSREISTSDSDLDTVEERTNRPSRPHIPRDQGGRDLTEIDNFAARLVNANVDDENFTGKDKKRDETEPPRPLPPHIPRDQGGRDLTEIENVAARVVSANPNDEPLTSENKKKREDGDDFNGTIKHLIGTLPGHGHASEEGSPQSSRSLSVDSTADNEHELLNLIRSDGIVSDHQAKRDHLSEMPLSQEVVSSGRYRTHPPGEQTQSSNSRRSVDEQTLAQRDDQSDSSITRTGVGASGPRPHLPPSGKTESSTPPRSVDEIEEALPEREHQGEVQSRTVVSSGRYRPHPPGEQIQGSGSRRSVDSEEALAKRDHQGEIQSRTVVSSGRYRPHPPGEQIQSSGSRRSVDSEEALAKRDHQGEVQSRTVVSSGRYRPHPPGEQIQSSGSRREVKSRSMSPDRIDKIDTREVWTSDSDVHTVEGRDQRPNGYPSAPVQLKPWPPVIKLPPREIWSSDSDLDTVERRTNTFPSHALSGHAKPPPPFVVSRREILSSDSDLHTIEERTNRPFPSHAVSGHAKTPPPTKGSLGEVLSTDSNVHTVEERTNSFPSHAVSGHSRPKPSVPDQPINLKPYIIKIHSREISSSDSDLNTVEERTNRPFPSHTVSGHVRPPPSGGNLPPREIWSSDSDVHTLEGRTNPPSHGVPGNSNPPAIEPNPPPREGVRIHPREIWSADSDLDTVERRTNTPSDLEDLKRTPTGVRYTPRDDDDDLAVDTPPRIGPAFPQQPPSHYHHHR